eukprot:scaffold48920_cov38-Cyclotella_meneghiniana.AAC.1
MSVVALLTVIAFTLRVVAYVVDFLLIDSIWLLVKLCLYALISSNVARLYEADTPIAVFGVFKVIVFLMECTSVNAALIAFTLKIVAYVVGFLLIDGIWVSARLSLYALFSVKVACLYEVDTPIVVFVMFQVIVFLMECPSVNAMPITEQERRERDKARRRMKRQNETPEERSKRLRSRREKWASTSHEINERLRSKRQSETKEQRAERLENERERWSNRSQQQNQRRQAQRHSETNEQRAQHRLDERERWTDRRQQQNERRQSRRRDKNEDESDIRRSSHRLRSQNVRTNAQSRKAFSERIKLLMKNAASALQVTNLDRTKQTNRRHRAPVCLVCDCFITGAHVGGLPCMTRGEILRRTNRLSVQKYEQDYRIRLKPSLKRDYEVPGFEGMLLSKRGIQTAPGKYAVCLNCKKSLNNDKANAGPPKFAIANGNAIGSFPTCIPCRQPGFENTMRQIDLERDISPVMKAFMAPIRPFGYVLQHSGGRQKCISGHYQFFETDQTCVSGALNFMESNISKNVFVMICGATTKRQRETIMNRTAVN